MANAFLKAEVIAATALGLLEREMILSRLVWSNAGFDFTGAKADTVTVRIPASTTAREYEWRNERPTDIVLDSLAEDSITVTLNKDIYSAVAVTDEELTLDIKDFGSQVLQPQVNAVAKAVDTGVATMIEGAAYGTPTVTLDAKDPWEGIVDARAALNKNEVPQEGRTLLVGADVETALLKSKRLSDVATSGSDSALRNATVGRLAGFDVVVSNAIKPRAAYAFVPSAFVLATRAPAIPAGVTSGSSQSYGGLSMRWIRDYDAAKLRDRSILNLYTGFNVMTDKVGSGKKLVRAVKLDMPTPPAGS
ncbi:P22 phage major capsid protein family protein [Streptomyces sp. MNP-20]|uniref:P22 phage major capsid protein family protein n=1 Tax=Streptomyces sp. MNP-20 TaxID=2721165 RepID=UPI001552B39B|nr:P22 phage major capsid protein family protein [Streptomyces sp. MNP-20]